MLVHLVWRSNNLLAETFRKILKILSVPCWNILLQYYSQYMLILVWFSWCSVFVTSFSFFSCAHIFFFTPFFVSCWCLSEVYRFSSHDFFLFCWILKSASYKYRGLLYLLFKKRHRNQDKFLCLKVFILLCIIMDWGNKLCHEQLRIWIYVQNMSLNFEVNNAKCRYVYKEHDGFILFFT